MAVNSQSVTIKGGKKTLFCQQPKKMGVVSLFKILLTTYDQSVMESKKETLVNHFNITRALCKTSHFRLNRTRVTKTHKT